MLQDITTCKRNSSAVGEASTIQIPPTARTFNNTLVPQDFLHGFGEGSTQGFLIASG